MTAPTTSSPRAALAAAAAATVALGALGACAPGPPPETGPSPALPPVPEVRGELDLYVAYPDAGDPIAAFDSNFVFGTTGTGAAELTVDGRPVDVQPNGAFLAWLPVPERSAGDTARYRLVARAEGRADTLVHPVVLPARPYEGEGEVWVDTASLSGLAERWGPPTAVLERTVRAAPGLEAWVEVFSTADPAADTLPPEAGEGAGPSEAVDAPRRAGRIPVEETRPGRYRLRAELGRLARMAARTDTVDPDTAGPDARDAAEASGPMSDAAAAGAVDTLGLRLRTTDGHDTASASGRLAVRLLDRRRPPVATLAEEPHPVHGVAGRVAARPSPRGSHAWRLPPGSSAPVDRRVGDRLRLRLGPHLHAWVAAEDVATGTGGPLPAGREAPVASVGRVGAEPRDDRIRVRVPVGRRLPAHAEPAGPRSVRLVVHGGLGATERMLYGPDDPLLAGLRWRQEAGPRWVLTVRTAEPVWGWDLRWDDVPGRREGTRRTDGDPGAAEPTEGDGAPDRTTPGRPLPEPSDPGTLVLDVRRPPEIDDEEPLRGVRVAVDPGHPPVGAEGPTGLTEAEANMGVARALESLLADAGAEPILVRTDTAAVGLYERRQRAADAGADLLVSVHNNALPDGLRPFGREGTSTYYFHAHARRLARHVQDGMLGSMGLRDLGVRWGNLALPREAWMPSVLTEGAFMMFPRHEAALRTPAFREAYAEGVLEGIRRFLEEHAAATRRGAGG